MNPSLLFWIPAALRGAMIFVAGGVGWFFFGLSAGVVITLIGLLALIVVHLLYLYRLSAWLDDPASESLPDGWGAWEEVFSRLYRLRREDERNKLELTEWLARFRQTMHVLPDGVAIIDDVLLLEWCNPAAEQHLGLRITNDEGRRVTNLVRNPEFIDYLILGRYDRPLTIALRDRELMIRIIPFENRRQILVTHDVTEAERAATMRRDFVANASHELRTPLTVINGFLEIADGNTALDPVTRSAHLKLMLEQGQRMQRLIDDMLTLTRLESVNFPLRPEPVAVRELVDSIVRESELLSDGRHRIIGDVAGPDIMGNTDELRSAFSNLVSNAVRYTPAGGQIDVSWQNGADGPEFIVHDNGIGIEPEHISRLTERFYRVDKSRSRETQGTGLGLAIVKHVLLRHNAALDIESSIGQGSTFTVHFPKRLIVMDE